MTDRSPDPGATVGGGIVVRGLEKRFGAKVALRGVDLDVAPGEIVALLGRNGAGKSTLLRILGTTVLPDSGTATISGFDVRGDPTGARRSTGVVLGDERSWYWRLSGQANLEFFGAMYGLRRPVARRRAAEVLAIMKLEAVADQRFDGYSSGMRARLSIGRSILAGPRVLLLDEPSRALDPVIASEFRELICEIAAREHLAVLWVTHDLAEATEIADRVVVIAGGRVVAERARTDSASELAEIFRALTVEDQAS